MKKILTVSALALGLVSTCAMAQENTGWSYKAETSKHNIRVSCPEPNSTACTYESWNKPKKVGQGTPDLTIQNGEHMLAANGNSAYTFTTGNVTIELFDELRGNKDDSLDVSVNGKRKNHYHLTWKN